MRPGFCAVRVWLHPVSVPLKTRAGPTQKDPADWTWTLIPECYGRYTKLRPSQPSCQHCALLRAWEPASYIQQTSRRTRVWGTGKVCTSTAACWAILTALGFLSEGLAV